MHYHNNIKFSESRCIIVVCKLSSFLKEFLAGYKGRTVERV